VNKPYNRTPNKECLVCGRRVYRRPVELKLNKGRVFCSSACFGFSCRKERPCTVCGKSILASAHKKTCSRACANIHRAGIRYRIGKPRDKTKTQPALKKLLADIRGKVCERCSYSVYEVLQIHHKDRNRENNSLSNLELICPNCHFEEHYLVR
jgi:hypothetical protein